MKSDSPLYTVLRRSKFDLQNILSTGNAIFNPLLQVCHVNHKRWDIRVSELYGSPVRDTVCDTDRSMQIREEIVFLSIGERESETVKARELTY